MEKKLRFNLTKALLQKKSNFFFLGLQLEVFCIKGEFFLFMVVRLLPKKEAHIIAGVSSAGKSSLAAALSKRGFSILTDDISVIGFKKEIPYVHPGTPYLKLWSDVLSHFKEDNKLKRVRPKLEKFYKPIRKTSLTEAVPLKSITILSVKNTPGFNFERLGGANMFNQLWRNTYRMQYSENLDQSTTQFNNLSRLSNNTNVFRVERAAYPLEIDELADFIEEKIIKR